jgi:hypothetical protein
MIDRHPALKGKPERFFIWTDIVSGEQFVAEQITPFRVHLYQQINKSSIVLSELRVPDKEDIAKDLNTSSYETSEDYRSWMYLKGINEESKPEQLEDTFIIDSEGTEIKIYLDGKNRIKERLINGKNRYYWSKTNMVYNNNTSYLEYKNSQGVHTKTFRNNGKTICNWISGKPNTTHYGKRN